MWVEAYLHGHYTYSCMGRTATNVLSPLPQSKFFKNNLAITYTHNFLKQNLYMNCFAPPPCLLRSSSNSLQSFRQVPYSRHIILRAKKSHLNISYMLLEYLLPFINLTTLNLCYCMPFATGWRVRWSDPGWARFYSPVQTVPGAHPASYTMGTGSLYRG